MKEKIYTIPVNDAVDGKPGCPLCRMEHTLEQGYLDRALGGAMMEPDEREKTNAHGFCRQHAQKLLQRRQALPFALILDTHIDTLEKILQKNMPFSDNPDISAILKRMSEVEGSCHICAQMEETFARYIDTLFLLWRKDEDFQARLLCGDGLCIPHFVRLLEESASYLPKAMRGDFCARLCAYERSSMEKLSGDVHWFCQKFDYRNADEPWGDAKDAPQRAVRLLTGAEE